MNTLICKSHKPSFFHKRTQKTHQIFKLRKKHKVILNLMAEIHFKESWDGANKSLEQ